MNIESCRTELNRLLAGVLKGSIEIDQGLDCDYTIESGAGLLKIQVSRLRNALCALGDIEGTIGSGRIPESKRVSSPICLRFVEAWAPMHSHGYLPIPEYHEHSWHIRMRKQDFKDHQLVYQDVDEAEMDMAVARFEKYVRLVAKQGFTHLVLDDQDYLVLFPKHRDIYPAGDHYYRRHQTYRSLFRRLLDITTAHDMSFVLFCQEIGYTPRTQAWFGDVCPRNGKLWAHLEEKYNELVEVFPEFDGFLIKVSDSFPPMDGMYFHTDLFRHDCPKCHDLSGPEKIKLFVDHMSQVIVQNNNRNLYYRTWDVSHGIHVDIDQHRRIFAGIEGARVFPLLKYTNGDFQISNPFHPGIGGMKNQVVEYQFKLEHDGHSVLPLYIGAVHEQSLSENIAKGIAGVWGWPSGGGRSSINNITHFKGFTRFAEMNQFVFAHKMMEPDVPHTDFLAMWGDLVLGGETGRPLADILCELTEAFTLMGNFGDLWTGSREYSKSAFHHGWFYDWHAFRHGGSAPESGAENICTRVLPYISDLEAAITRVYKGAGMFRLARSRFERDVARVAGFEHAYAGFHTQFMAAEAFAGLCALWVESLLRFYSGNHAVEHMMALLDRLESAKILYDRHYGVFVTQCMDFFLPKARNALAAQNALKPTS